MLNPPVQEVYPTSLSPFLKLLFDAVFLGKELKAQYTENQVHDAG